MSGFRSLGVESFNEGIIGNRRGEQRLGNGAGVEEDSIPPGVGAHLVGERRVIIVEVVDDVGGIESDESPQSQDSQECVSGEKTADGGATSTHGWKYR